MDFVLSIVVLLLSCIVLLPLIKNHRKNKRISKYIDVLPGEKRYPVIGTILNSMQTSREDYFELVKSRHRRFGPFMRSWYGPVPVVHVYKPEHAQTIFKSTTILSKGKLYDYLLPWLGEGLISGSNLPKWRAHRKMITPCFHFKMLDRYGDVFAEKSQIFVDYLSQFDGKGFFEVTQHLNRITLDIICEAAMGVTLNFLNKSDGEEYVYAQAIFDFLGTLNKRVRNPLLSNDLVFGLTKAGKLSRSCVEKINDFNHKVIRTRRAQLKELNKDVNSEDELGRKQKLSFLDMLLTYQDQNMLNDKEIDDEVNTFMFGGQDTTAATLTSSFMALGNNPDILKKVHEELDTIFADDPDRKITTQDLAQMEYLDRVLKEVFRCYCFVPLLGRELHEDIEIDGVFIPQGVSVFISLEDLHHDPNHYPDPYKFDPDRFLPENCAKRHPYAFVPFSAGPRNCLGQKFAVRNSKTLLAYILRRYTVKCLEKPEDMKYYCEIVLKPQNGLHIALESRRRFYCVG